MITKQTIIRNEADYSAGEAILIDKHSGITSFGIVNRLRRIIHVKKVGHAGTLDPRATGLLIICTGKKTKTISSFQDLPKVYSGIIKLGEKTSSMDSETEVIEKKSTDGISEDMIFAVRDKFIGDIEQIPPMYSALKHNGKALYKYARKGEEIMREPRKVKIYNFKITGINLPEIHFEIKCSKGTYIRSIANDLGDMLNCGGHLQELRREKIGDYSVEDALTLKEFEDHYSVQVS